MINLITDLISFTQPTNLDRETLSVIESIAKIKKVVNECITQFNNLENKTDEDYNNFLKQIKDYKNYIENLCKQYRNETLEIIQEFKELIKALEDIEETVEWIKKQSEFVQDLAKQNQDAIDKGTIVTKDELNKTNTSVEENTNRITNAIEIDVAEIKRKNPNISDDELMKLIFTNVKINSTVLFPSVTYNLTKKVVIDLGKVSIKAKGTIFRFSNLEDECGIEIKNTINTGRTHNNIEGLTIDGGTDNIDETIAKGKIGIKLDIPEGENGFNYVRVLSKITILKFETGIFFGRKTYLIEFRDGYISQCDKAISIWDTGTATPDGGAVLTFVHCEIMHNNEAIKCNNPISSVYFNRCAIDYNNSYITLNNGSVFFTNCNLENGHENSTEYPFTINPIIQNKNKTLLCIDNCWIIHTSMKGSNINIESLFLNNNGTIILKNSVINQIRQKSLYLHSGNGDIVYKDNLSNYGNFVLLNNESLMYDSDFEKTDDILDEIIFDFNTPLPSTISNLIVNDTHNTNLVKIEKTSEVSKTGTKSLKVTKLADSWGSYFNIIIPLSNNNCKHAIKFFYKEGAPQTNKNILELFYCKKSKKYINNNYYTLIPMSNSEDAVKTVNINQSTTWNQLTVTTDKKPPKYADSIVLRFWYKNSDKNIAYYYDNFEITEI